MKYKKIFLSYLTAVTMASCNNLDVPPMNIVQDKDVFQSESGITAYMARLYTELPIEDFKFNRDNFDQWANIPSLSNCTGEMLLAMADMVWDSPSGDWCGAWRYGPVRNVNYFINEFPSYSNSFTSDQTNAWLGEAYFVRAYCYFSMVKRYGGVPIIKTVQNYPEQSLEELKVPRNTEQEVYDFVAEDLDKAIDLLPETAIAKGRVSKNIARALKSRAMLYAGSIAQYGQTQLNNILGIPMSEAKRYYEAAYEAAKSLEGKYSLYNKHADKFENYWKLFLDEDSPENIFCKYYKYPEYTHSFDVLHIPYQMRGAEGYSSRFCPTLDFVEMFDDVNGQSDWLKVGTTDNPVRYGKRMDLFKDVEPRLRGSVILPGDDFKNEEIDVQKGIYVSYPSGELLTSSDFNLMYKDKSVIGRSGMGPNETTCTGFLARKYQNPDIPKSQVILGKETQHWIDIRYAEILLNRAEAAFQIGKTDDALSCINLIRERAGAKLYTADQLTAKAIQKERRMELAFENHTYWDLRRWRIADSEINNRQFKALCPYYVYDEDRFIFKKEFVGPKYTFDVKVNYVKIPAGEISTNGKLVQNPGY